MFWLFKQKTEEPIIGDWYLLQPVNPFEPVPVRVLAIKDGWVQYTFQTVADRRPDITRTAIKITDFNQVYKHAPNYSPK